MVLLNSTAFVIVLTGIVVYFIVKSFLSWQRLRHIPGPPIAGWTKLWLLHYVISGKLCTKLEDICCKYGKANIVSYRVHVENGADGPDWVVCGDTDEIQRIWSIRSQYHRAEWYRATRLNPDEDNVLTMLDTKGHHRLRMQLAPAYSGKGMDNQEQLVDEQVEKLIALFERKYISTQMNVQPCNLSRMMQYLTQDVITAVGFGKATGYLDSDEDTLGIIETCERLLPAAHIVMFLPMVRKFLESRLFKPFAPKPTDKHGIGGLLGIITSHVDNRYGDSKIRNTDMLQTFVDSSLNREQVEAESLVTLFGGTDTTSTALRMTIFFLSTTPHACRKIQAEIDDALANPVTARPVIADEQAKKLPYLQACIREGMRLWPPSMALLPKTSDRDQVVCGYRVPAGTNVGWAGLTIMKSPRVFGQNAEVFEPLRWIDAEPEKLRLMEATYGLIFATGTKWECLGKRLAYEELGKVIFELFARYDFAMMKPMQPFQWINHGFTTHRDMNVRITRREMPRRR